MYPIDEFKYSLIKKFLTTQYENRIAHPLIIGMQGIQGCGKSHTCHKLQLDLESQGIRTIILSLDDFYYDRERMANQIRGHPGTHDIQYLCNVIDKLKNQETCRIPIYNKYAHRGKGDRKGYKIIEIDSKDVEIVLVEGWCIGFSSYSNIDESFSLLNQDVKYYEELLTPRLDAIIIIISSYQNSFKWRLRAEKNAKMKGYSGMNDEEVNSFVSHFIPVYKLYLNKMQFTIPTCKIYCNDDISSI